MAARAWNTPARKGSARYAVWVINTLTLGGHTFAAFYNGKSWVEQFLPMNVLSVSAIQLTTVWVVGSSEQDSVNTAMRWDGKAWQTIPLPNLRLPAHSFLIPFAIAAVSARSAWVYGYVKDGRALPGRLLRWTGSRWITTDTPAGYDIGESMAQDGQGGVWLPFLSATHQEEFLHYRGGTWTRRPAPLYQSKRSLLLKDIAWVPGTRSDLAVAATFQKNSVGVILQRG